MKRNTIAILAMTALAMSVVTAPQAGAELPKRVEGPKLVARDKEGDWGQNSALGSNGAAIGDALGQDLIEGSIEMADDTKEPTVNFIIKVKTLPRQVGGWPEVTRYVWGLTIDGEYVELDGKYMNYSRGVCDATSGQCPPLRDPGQQPFFVRGNCKVAQDVATCEEIGVVQGVFAPDEGPSLHLPRPPATITVAVPLQMLGAKRGSRISAGMSDFATTAGGSIIAMPEAFFASAAVPLDAMEMFGTFKVPRK